ncbi:MAG: hypothetical protein HBSAPP03_19800 [Phycisphaerae bacterium]|nr:MAG: hypothetical protein HBSAPP03_19800 [Phycisphaerae bacterium]
MRRKRKHLPALVEAPIAALIRGAMTAPLALGLPAALGMARGLGEVYPRLQPKRFERAVRNLRDAYPAWSEDRVRANAVASYQHLFQLGVELLFTPRLVTRETFARHLHFSNASLPGVLEVLSDSPVILITGHVGNWELVGYAMSMLGFRVHAVYRPLDLRPLDAWVRDTRERRGLTLVSKFGAMKALPRALARREPVGLVADQSGGERGVFVPFFGRLTSTYKSVGMLALQSKARLVCGYARRLAPGEPPPPTMLGEQPRAASADTLRYVVETVDVFGPDEYMAQPDPLYYITARYRRALEAMVRRSPEQYFWMHRVWRSRPLHERTGKPFPAHLRAKLEALPWMTPADVEAVVERSARDAADLKALQR